MLIDSHAHVMLPTSRQLQLMAEAGIDRTILFATTPHPEQCADLAAFRAEYDQLRQVLAGNSSPAVRAAKANRELVTVISQHPERYLGFGLTPIGLTQSDTARWIEEEIIAQGLLGLGEFTPTPGAISQMQPVFAAAADYGLPLWVHTFEPCGLAELTGLYQLAKTYPRLPIILGHCGGVHWIEAIMMAKEQANLYLDLSAAFTIFIPKIAMRELPERTLFSSDAPYGDPLLARESIERLSPSKEVTANVMGGNLRRLLNF